VLHVNSFNVDYRPDGSVQQFKSDLSVFDLDGREKQKKTISVNQPIRLGLCTPHHDNNITVLQLLSCQRAFSFNEACHGFQDQPCVLHLLLVAYIIIWVLLMEQCT